MAFETLGLGVLLLSALGVMWQLFSIRVSRLERKLDLIVRGLGFDVAERLKLSERVKEIARDPGRKIEAIRTYREETGCGLAEAKDAVEIYLSSLKT